MNNNMTKEEIVNIIEISHRHIDKKYANDPSYVIRKRVANTAGDVIKIVNNLSFSELAYKLQYKTSVKLSDI